MYPEAILRHLLPADFAGRLIAQILNRTFGSRFYLDNWWRLDCGGIIFWLFDPELDGALFGEGHSAITSAAIVDASSCSQSQG